MLFFLNRDQKIVGVANNVGTSLKYFNDIHTQNIEAGTESYEFTVPSNHEGSEHAKEGNFVVRKDLDGESKLFTIIEVQETHSTEHIKTCYCESAGLELLNEVDEPYTETTPQTIQYYIGKAIDNPETGWDVGYCDVFNTRTLVFTEYTNVLDRLLLIASEFDAELTFTVRMNGTSVQKRYVNVYRKVGNNTGKRFVYSKDMNSITRKMDMGKVVTALLPIGKADDNKVNTKITALTFDDGDIYTLAGSDYLYSRSALVSWGKVGGNIHDVFQYDIVDASELLNRSITELRSRIQPSALYETDVALLERVAGYEHEAVRIGDTIKVVDTTFNPPLYLEARIVELATSYTDPSQNKATLGNYRIVKSNISADIRALQSKLFYKEATWDTVENTFSEEETLEQINTATDPIKIIDTVIYSEDFTSILSEKAEVEDLAGLATGEMVTASQAEAIVYIDGRLDGAGGVIEGINEVSSALEKTANEITAKFTSTGGVNLIKNSIGYVGTDFWTVTGTMNVLQNNELEELGFGSGWYSALGITGYMEQTFKTKVGDNFSLSFWLNKLGDDPTTGYAGVEIWENGVPIAFVGKYGGTGETNGYELGLYSFETHYTEIKLRVAIGAGTSAIITGLMFNVGDEALQWQHAPGEIYNTNVQMNLNGVKVTNINTGSYTIMSPTEFSGYSVVDGMVTRTFTLNGDTTEVYKLKTTKEIAMSPIKIIPIVSTPSTGWAFVATD